MDSWHSFSKLSDIRLYSYALRCPGGNFGDCHWFQSFSLMALKITPRRRLHRRWEKVREAWATGRAIKHLNGRFGVLAILPVNHRLDRPKCPRQQTLDGGCLWNGIDSQFRTGTPSSTWASGHTPAPWLRKRMRHRSP